MPLRPDSPPCRRRRIAKLRGKLFLNQNSADEWSFDPYVKFSYRRVACTGENDTEIFGQGFLGNRFNGTYQRPAQIQAWNRC